MLWEQQDQNAYKNVPQVLTETELLPFIISDTNKHVHYRDPTSLNISHLELIILDNQLIIEHSEMSDNRPYTTTTIISETSSKEYYRKILRPDTEEDTFHFHSDDHSELFQNQEPQQLHIVQVPQQDTKTFKNIPDPSETATIQKVSEISDITINNPKSLTVTNESSILQIPVHDITQNTLRHQN